MRVPPEQLSVLSYADAGVHLYGNAVLASSKMMAEKPEVVRAFLRATQKALVETLAQPDAALARCVRVNPWCVPSKKVHAGRSHARIWPMQKRHVLAWAALIPPC